ncbi:MAG: monofunctional biosynthetic peptidoglycan transglycosylase [Pseudomonadota bacterium]
MPRRRFSFRELPIVQWLTRGAVVLRWTLRIFLILLIIDLFYLAVIWPDWKKLAAGPVPVSSFMQEYKRERAGRHDWPDLRWQPVTLQTIPKTVQRAVILSEDSRFYTHSGFDLLAFKEAMGRNLDEGRLAFGASTISQQTVKNLFLTRSRDPLRKWHELILTWGMEQSLTKHRILELYLNVAEFGHGVYGVQAAARHYWDRDVEQLTPQQAAELAATLPSPRKHNPATRSEAFDKRAQRVLRLLNRYPGDAADLLPPALPADNPELSRSAPTSRSTRGVRL